MIPDGDILRVVYVPTAHVGLPVFSVRELLLLVFIWNIMAIEAIETYCTTSSHLARYNDLQSDVSKGFSSGTRNMVPAGDIVHIVYVPTAHFGLLVFSVGEILLLVFIWNIMAIEAIEAYCTTSSHLERYHDLQSDVSKGYSSGTRNMVPDGDIVHVVYVPTAYVGLPVISVVEILLLVFIWNIMAIETMERYCTTSSYLERYNDLQSDVSKSFSSGTRNMIPDGDILHVVYVPTAHVGLPVFSVGEILLLVFIWNIMAIETKEWYCTTLTHLERYNDLQSDVSKSFSSGIRNMIPDGDILRVLCVPTAHFGLPVFSVGEMLIITFLCNVRAQSVYDPSTTCIKGYPFLRRISDFQFT